MKKLLLTLAILLLGFTNQAAKATVLTFDDYTTSSDLTEISTSYGGFNWVNTYLMAPESYYSGSLAGYRNGLVSPDYIVFNAFAYDITVTSDSLFTFNGAYLTGAWNDGLNVTVEGYQGSSLLFDQTVVTSAYNPTWFDFNFVDVDKLVFHSFGGEDAPEFSGNGTHFVMDNFTYNEIPAPEPTTMLLGLMGLAGAAKIRRKK